MRLRMQYMKQKQWGGDAQRDTAECFQICQSVHLRGEFRAAVSLLLFYNICQDASAAHDSTIMIKCSDKV